MHDLYLSLDRQVLEKAMAALPGSETSLPSFLKMGLA
jgi:hypothetical protein